jgi:hypothetical protein
MFANFFSENHFDEKDPKSSDYKAIQDLLGLFMKAVNYLEDKWQYFINSDKEKETNRFSPFFKAFIMYCIGFLVTFFGIFVKLDKHPYINKEGLPIQDFTIVNLPRIFSHNDGANTYALAGFFLGLMAFVIIFFGTVTMALKQQNVPGSRFQGITWLKYLSLSFPIITIGVCLIYFFGGGNFVKMADARTTIYTILMFLFALLGTSLVYCVFEALSYIFGPSNTMTASLFSFWPRFIKIHTGFDIGSGSNLVTIILSIIFIGLWVGMAAGGASNSWISQMESTDPNSQGDRPFNMVVVIIICMAVGTLMAMSTRFRVFASAVGFLLFLAQMITKWLGPITVLGISTAQLTLSSKAANATNQLTDDINIKFDLGLERKRLPFPSIPNTKRREMKQINLFDIQKAIKDK